MRQDSFSLRPGSAGTAELLLATLLGIGLMWLLVSLSLPLRYSYQNDSSGYVDEARMLLQSEGIRRVAPWHDPDHEYVPTALFPPGFAVQTALVSLAGPDPAQAARLASWIAWALLAPAILFATAPLIGPLPAIIVGMLAMLSPGFYEWGYPALSDSSALLYSILSLSLLIHAKRSIPAGALWLLLSGLLAGVAFAMRNAALVVPLAVAGTLALLWLWRRQTFMASFREGFWWGLGFLLVAALVFGRNLLLFGSIQPYVEHHGGGEYGLLRAFRLTLWSQLLDISGSRRVAELAWDARALLLSLPPLAVLLAWLGWRRRRDLSGIALTAFALLGLYSLIGFAMVVWGRSRFDWVEVNLSRHMMAYSWSLLTLLMWPLIANLDHRSSVSVRAGLAVALVVTGLALLTGRAAFIRDDLQREIAALEAGQAAEEWSRVAEQVPDVILTNYVKLELSRNKALLEYLQGRDDQPYLLSNFAAVIRLETGLPARNFDLSHDNLAALGELHDRLRDRPLLLVLAASNSMLRNPGEVGWQAEVLQRLPIAYQVERRTPNLLVVELP